MVKLTREKLVDARHHLGGDVALQDQRLGVGQDVLRQAGTASPERNQAEQSPEYCTASAECRYAGAAACCRLRLLEPYKTATCRRSGLEGPKQPTAMVFNSHDRLKSNAEERAKAVSAHGRKAA